MNMPSKSRPSREQHAASIAAFQQEGLKIARTIGNRGPVRFDADGKRNRTFCAFNEHGFYVFEGDRPPMITELRADANTPLERAPRPPCSGRCRGRRAGHRFPAAPLQVCGACRPVGAPEFRGDTCTGQPSPMMNAPTDVVYLMYWRCQEMPSGLRLSAPHLLAIAKPFNGRSYL